MSFGASGQEEFAQGLVTERFTLRPADNFSSNRHIKSIVRMNRVQSEGPDPHHFKVRGGTFGETGEQIAEAFSSMPRHSLLRIHHYHTKSRQEYLRRIAGGKADAAPPRPPSEFDLYQAADVEDRAAWRFLPALKRRLEPRAEPGADPTPADTVATISSERTLRVLPSKSTTVAARFRVVPELSPGRNDAGLRLRSVSLHGSCSGTLR